MALGSPRDMARRIQDARQRKPANRSFRHDGDSLMGGIIHHCQDIHDTPFSRAIKYKVHRPDLVGGPRAVQRLSICNRDLLALTPSHLQAGFGIQTFHPLVVDYCGFLSNESLARHEPYA